MLLLKKAKYDHLMYIKIILYLDLQLMCTVVTNVVLFEHFIKLFN